MGATLKVTRALRSYGVAVAATVVAALLYLALPGLLHPVPFILFLASVMVSAWYGGARAGALATALGGAFCAFLILEPRYSLAVADRGDLLRLVLYCLVSGLICGLSQALHRARFQAESAVAQLRSSEVQREALLAREQEARAEAEEQRQSAILQAERAHLAGEELQSQHEELQQIEEELRIQQDELRQAYEQLHQQQGRLTFILEASMLLAGSLDYETTLRNLARLAVPKIADWCVVSLVPDQAEEGVTPLRRLAIAHADPERLREVEELQRDYPPDPRAPYGPERVVRTGQPELFEEITDALLVGAARDTRHLELLRNLKLRSSMVVPLATRERIIGALTLVAAESGRRYGPEDLALAEELARRCALAVENARLYHQAQEAVRLRDEALSRQRSVEEGLTLLIRASEALLGSLHLETVLGRLLDVSRSLIAADAYAVWRHYPESQEWRIVTAAGLSPEYIQGSIPTAGTTVTLSSVAAVEDVTAAGMLEERLAGYRREGVQSILVAPLRVREETSGTITFYYRQRHHFTETEQQLAAALANLASSAVGTAELYGAQSRLRGAAEAAQGRFRDLVNGLEAVVWEASAAHAEDGTPRWHYTFVSQQAARILGYEPEQWLASPQFWLDTIDPADRPTAEALYAGVISTGQDASLDYRVRSADGRTLWVRDTVRAALGEDGRPTQLRGVLLDVTERKWLEVELRERMEDLADADRRKDNFLAMLAHELRNPLGALRNAVQLLHSAGAGESARARAMAVVERQVQHQVRLVDELLDVSRITRGKVELRVARVDLTRIVLEAVEDHRRPAEQSALELSVEAPDESLWLDGDPTRLAQVFGNLLSNAVKFTPAGGRIRVRLEREGERASVTVADTGIGVDPEMLEHIFEAFTQEDRSLDRSRGGLGLGLALVKGLVVLHGGQVAARSEGVGRGSEFVVTLPLARAAEGAAPAEEGTTPPQPEPSGETATRILVIEDNRDAAETLRDLLELSGYEVDVALSGSTGVEKASSFKPSVVLCDIGLPGMSGYEVAAALREHPATAGAWLIAVSGYGREEDLHRSRVAGFDLHLTKPVDPQELQRLLADNPNTR